MTFPPTSFRLDPALLARVDAYAAQLAEKTGVPVSRHAAVAKLLNAALLTTERTGRPNRPSSRASRR